MSIVCPTADDADVAQPVVSLDFDSPVLIPTLVMTLA